jgi:hypothetical protein
MKNEYQAKAENYIREKLPELMELSEGCVIQKQTILQRNSVSVGEDKIIGHPIQLQHWLRVLDEGVKQEGYYYYMFDGSFHYEPFGKPQHVLFWFNPKTGQPATEADYKAFNEIVGICQSH